MKGKVDKRTNEKSREETVVKDPNEVERLQWAYAIKKQTGKGLTLGDLFKEAGITGGAE